MAGLDKALDEARDIAITDHHPFRDVRQGHSLRNLVELGHQVKPRKRDIEPRAQPASHLPLDQGRTGQKAKPQPKLVAMVFREFDSLALGIKDHAIIPDWRPREGFMPAAPKACRPGLGPLF